VTSIGLSAFQCSGLISVTIGDSVTKIESLAFYQCSSLTYITCLAIIPPVLEWPSFDGPLQAIYVPAQSVDEYKNAREWSQYADIIVGI
jgi:hypothetical protein